MFSGRSTSCPVASCRHPGACSAPRASSDRYAGRRNGRARFCRHSQGTPRQRCLHPNVRLSIHSRRGRGPSEVPVRPSRSYATDRDTACAATPGQMPERIQRVSDSLPRGRADNPSVHRWKPGHSPIQEERIWGRSWVAWLRTLLFPKPSWQAGNSAPSSRLGDSCPGYLASCRSGSVFQNSL